MHAPRTMPIIFASEIEISYLRVFIAVKRFARGKIVLIVLVFDFITCTRLAGSKTSFPSLILFANDKNYSTAIFPLFCFCLRFWFFAAS